VRRVLWLGLLLFVACGKEGSIVPVVQIAPSPTAQVTFEPHSPPPTVAPTIAPAPTVVLATPKPTPRPTPKPTPLPTPTPAPAAGVHPPTSHAATPKNAPPDAYLRAAVGEIKGDITHYNWKTDAQGHRSLYDDSTPDPAGEITIKKGETLKISFTRTDTETNAGARYRTSPAANAKATAIYMDKKNPATITANFPIGTVWLDVFTYWPEGDVEHTFKLKVTS
jgi:hypothetical protein